MARARKNAGAVQLGTRGVLAARTERCTPDCPGWAIFEVDRDPGVEIEACDECNQIAREERTPTVDDDDVAALPEAQAALAAYLEENDLEDNPPLPEHRFGAEAAIRQFYDVLLPDPDPGSMIVAQDLCEEYGLKLADLGAAMAKHGFDNTWWSDTKGWADFDKHAGEFILSKQRTPFRVFMRPPKLGDRGWWVAARTPAAALEEAMREGAFDNSGFPDLGWLADKDYTSTPDEHDMIPVTLEYAPDYMTVGWSVWKRPPGKRQIPKVARGGGYLFGLHIAYDGKMWDENRRGISGLSSPDDDGFDYDDADPQYTRARTIDARRRRLPVAANSLAPIVGGVEIAVEKTAVAAAVKIAWACAGIMKAGRQKGLDALAVARLFRKMSGVDMPPKSIVNPRNPWDVESDAGGREPFARREDAEAEVEGLRRRGIRAELRERTRRRSAMPGPTTRGNPDVLTREQAPLAFAQVIREPGMGSMAIADDIVLQYRIPLAELSEAGRTELSTRGAYVISDPAAPIDMIEWEVEKLNRPQYYGSGPVSNRAWAIGFKMTWHDREEWLLVPSPTRYLSTRDGAEQAAAADGWALAKQMKQAQVDEDQAPGLTQFDDVRTALRRVLSRTYVDKTAPEVYQMRVGAGGGLPKKKRTYLEARDAIWSELVRLRWTMSPADLKTPYATSPNGWLRLWFKPQGVHASTSGPMAHYSVARSEWVDTTHTLGNARAIAYDLDIRAITPTQFLDEVKQRYPQAFEGAP